MLFDIFNSHQRTMLLSRMFFKIIHTDRIAEMSDTVIKTVHQHTVGTICLHSTFMIA